MYRKHADTCCLCFNQPIKNYLDSPSANSSVIPLTGFLKMASLYLSLRSMITSKLVRTLYARYFQEGLRLTICKYGKWTEDVYGKVDWDIFGKVFTLYSRFHQISIAKFVHGLWNTGQQKVKYKRDEHR